MILRRDRLPALVGLLGVTILAWAYLVWLVVAMGDVSGMPRMGGSDAMSEAPAGRHGRYGRHGRRSG